MPAEARSAPDSAVMAKGTTSWFSLRFCAVRMISVRAGAGSPALPLFLANKRRISMAKSACQLCMIYD
jgi:hypothetical protein